MGNARNLVNPGVLAILFSMLSSRTLRREENDHCQGNVATERNTGDGVARGDFLIWRPSQFVSCLHQTDPQRTLKGQLYGSYCSVMIRKTTICCIIILSSVFKSTEHYRSITGSTDEILMNIHTTVTWRSVHVAV
jgi:hypothetical protein